MPPQSPPSLHSTSTLDSYFSFHTHQPSTSIPGSAAVLYSNHLRLPPSNCTPLFPPTILLQTAVLPDPPAAPIPVYRWLSVYEAWRFDGWFKVLRTRLVQRGSVEAVLGGSGGNSHMNGGGAGGAANDGVCVAVDLRIVDPKNTGGDPVLGLGYEIRAGAGAEVEPRGLESGGGGGGGVKLGGQSVSGSSSSVRRETTTTYTTETFLASPTPPAMEPQQPATESRPVESTRSTRSNASNGSNGSGTGVQKAPENGGNTAIPRGMEDSYQDLSASRCSEDSNGFSRLDDPGEEDSEEEDRWSVLSTGPVDRQWTVVYEEKDEVV